MVGHHCCSLGSFPWALLLLLLWTLKVQGDCGPPPAVSFASLRAGTASESYPVGTRLAYRCQPGYEFIRGKIPVLTCLENSKWSDENPEFCQGKQCPIPVKENGDIIAPNGLQLGSEITYTCSYGFRVIGANKARCMLNADNTVGWSRPPPHCQRVICYPPPAVENGRHSGEGKLDDFVFGDSITYTCNRDYSLFGTATLSCVVAANGLEGAWSPNAPECKVVRCDRPTISNGKLLPPYQSLYTYDNTVEFECYRGYTLVGSQTAKCGADSNWHPPVPICVKATNSRPALTVHPGRVGPCPGPLIRNGRITTAFQAHYPYEKIVSIDCDQGYTLSWKNTVQCGADNNWHPVLPECVKETFTASHATACSGAYMDETSVKFLEERLNSLERKLDTIMHLTHSFCNHTSKDEQ